MSAFSKLKINTKIKTSAKAYGRSYNREKVVRRLESYMTYWVRWEKEQKAMEVNAGKTLLEVMIEAGMHPDAPCGGEGKCGKCRVWCHGQGKKSARFWHVRPGWTETSGFEPENLLEQFMC